MGQDKEANLVDLLRKNNAFIPELSTVAMLGNKFVEHNLFTKIQIVKVCKCIAENLALSQKAARPEFQNKVIRGQLIEHGLEKAKTIIIKG